MDSTKYILGIFDDPDEMMKGIDSLKEKGVSIYDVFTPMPIHGIEDKLGIKESRLPVAAFIFGCIGLTAAFCMLYYMLVYDWPINIGGKPHFTAPNFVPICFEWTVLFSSFGMVFTYFYSNHLFPGRTPRVMDLRATNDRFVIAVNAKTNTQHDQIDSCLKEAGAVEIKHNDRKYVSYE